MRKWMKLNMKVLCGMLCAALCIASLCPNALGEQSAASAAIERSIRVGLGISPETPLTWELLTSVKTLVLKNQGLTDISSLSMCPNLEELYIDGNAIEDISSLMMMKQLRVLRAEDNAITDISALASLERLEEVNLKNNRVSDISALRGSQNLKSLTLDGNPITDISTLNVLTGLSKLSLRNTSPADFSALSSLTQLESLDLSYSGISDLSALRELTSLRYLYLQGNAISDVSPLANLSRLRTLNLEGNSNLQDTSPLLSLELESYMGPDIRQSETVVGEQEEEAALAITSAAQARNGVVRILMADDIDDPNYFATGSGFGVGVIGEETDIFVTNRHVVFDETSNRISNQVYIMLDDNAAKRVYSSFGGYYDEEADRMFKLYLDVSHMVKCEVLYPTNADPEFPDFAILKAERKIEGRVALPLLSADEVEDTTDIWTIGYPGSADKLYNMDSTWDEMKYEADVEGSQLFTGVISRRGKMKSLGNTQALTHSAQIDHGNSGGPLVIRSGQVIGINTYGFESSQTTSVGYYISIYIDYVMQKLDELGIEYNVTSSANNRSEDAQSVRESAENNLPASEESAQEAPSQPTLHREKVALRTKYVDYDDDEKVKNYSEYRYNEYGDMIERITYKADGSLNSRQEDEYDVWGNKLIERSYDSDNRLKEWTEYFYSDDLVYLGYETYDGAGTLKSWHEYLYDEDGLLYGDLYSGNSSTLYYRNPDGTVRKEVTVNENEEIEQSVEYEYDSQKNKIGELHINSDGTLNYLNEYEYDSDGNRTAYARYKADGLQYWVEYVYDDDGLKLGEILFQEDGSVNTYTILTYDAHGNETSSVKYHGDDSLYMWSEYDNRYDAEGLLTFRGYSFKDKKSGDSYYTPTDIWVREE